MKKNWKPPIEKQISYTLNFEGTTPITNIPNLVYFISVNCKKNWIANRHTHHFTELFLITNGKGYFHINKNSYFLEKGDIFIIDPYVEHYETTDENAQLEYIVLGVENICFFNSDEKSTHYEAESSHREFHHIKNFSKSEELKRYYDLIEKELSDANEDSNMAAINYLSLLLIFIKRELNLSFIQGKYTKYSKNVATVKQYIDSCFCEDISVDELARKIFVSKYYLIHHFKAQIGLTPIEYLIQVRINYAKTVLENFDYSVNAVSKISGFNNYTHFSTTFKKITGHSPKEYRALHKKQPHQN